MFETVESAIQVVTRYTSDCDYASAYGERGYSDPERAILLANWNGVPDQIQKYLEHKGYSLEWSDEWTTAGDTGKAYRTSPDCYDWTPYYVYWEGEIIGGDEIEKDPDWYVNEYLLNDPNHCNVFCIDFEKLGFKRVSEDDFESGWHPGQTDDPHEVFKRLEEKMPTHDFVFDLTEQSQFYCKWNAWSRPQ